MKIAQAAPLYESVPPKYYGGTERVVSYLTEELVRLGHKVVLFASGDSVTAAELRSQCPRALRLDPEVRDPVAYHFLMSERLAQEALDFDIIHSHIDYFPFSMMRRLAAPFVATLHGRLDWPDLEPVFREFWELPLISISNAQRGPLPDLRWAGTVYHGIPEDLYEFRSAEGKYLAFVGRLSPEKRVDEAIEMAKRSGIPLKIAAKINAGERDYFTQVLKPALDHPLIEYIGEIGEAEKNDFLGNALALLFPVGWPEPFGLVMIEAMACGTPVIAYPQGSVTEIMQDGLSGYVVRGVEEAVAAIKKISAIDRRQCRKYFESRFTASRMARDYLKIYQRIIEDGQAAKLPGSQVSRSLDF